MAFLVIELIIIVGAAALGVTSHFNVSSPLAIALWSTMATAISPGVVFYTAPIPPIKAIAADKIHRAGNILAVALCHHQKNIIA